VSTRRPFQSRTKIAAQRDLDASIPRPRWLMWSLFEAPTAGGERSYPDAHQEYGDC
jgi:hypothetical protein